MSVFIGYPSFMAYQMMKGKKDNNDGFPSITGMIARYSALGLTNEQMAANPVWVDKTGNGHDLQMKNMQGQRMIPFLMHPQWKYSRISIILNPEYYINVQEIAVNHYPIIYPI